MIAAARLAKGLWWDRAWSLVGGCTPVSEGCENCWSRAMERRWRGTVNDGAITLRSERLYKPMNRRKPAVYAVWNDLFHEDVREAFVESALAVMEANPQHVYVVLTKRIGRAASLLTKFYSSSREYGKPATGPVETLIIGTSAENQVRFNERIGDLLTCPAACRMLSLEPLLGPIQCYFKPSYLTRACDRIHWVVVGPETGSRRRSCRPVWVEWIVRQCQSTGVPVFVKALELRGKIVHDTSHPDWPDWAVRELPELINRQGAEAPSKQNRTETG